MSAHAKAEAGTAVAILDQHRLSWHDNISERFGDDLNVTKASWKVLTESIWPSAKTTDSIVMALAYCQHRKLDPFKKPVHIVPIWDSKKKEYIETVWPSIAEMRTTAFRTGQYAGCDETTFGPNITKKFSGDLKRDDKWTKVEETVEFPEWAQVTLYRMLNGVRCKFVGPKVYWLESYARQEPSDIPNRMWSRRRSGQLEKVAEAAALRKAFPEELGNEYAAEEMEGQRIFGTTIDHEPETQQAIPKKLKAPAPPSIVKEIAATETEAVAQPTESKPVPIRGKAPPPPMKKKAATTEAETVEPEKQGDPMDKALKAAILKELANCESTEVIIALQQKHSAALMEMSTEDREEIILAFQRARAGMEQT